MIKVSEALHGFLHARKTPQNADLIERWGTHMETQVNVAAGNGEPVAGKRTTWSDGVNEWYNLRIPKNAATEPTWNDYTLSFPLDLHAEGIGCTGWDWGELCSRWVGYDFDALTSHAKGVGVADAELARVRTAAEALPYVEARRSTGGGGVHLYVYLDRIPTANHTEHAALARCILGMMSNDTGFDFANQIDCCGGIMWIWHKKMTAENQGLAITKPTTKTLGIADLPTNWRDHIEVVTRRRTKIRINEVAEDDLDPFEALASSRKMIPLDDSHKTQIEALMRSGFTTLWITDHHLLQTHTCALQGLMGDKELKLSGLFHTTSEGRDPGTPNCLSGDTMVITHEGSKSLRDLAGTTTTILTAGGQWKAAPFKSFGKQQLLKITLQQQRSIKIIKATLNHGWFVAGRVQSNLQTGRAKFNHQRRVETQNLQVGDKLVQVFASTRAKLTPSVIGIQHGLVWGDGNAHKQIGKSSSPVCRLSLFGEKDSALLPYFNRHPQRPIHTKAGIPGVEIANLPGHFKSLVDLKYDKPYLYGWLAGYFAADGHVTKVGCCIIRSYNKKSIQHVRDVCNLLGISTSPINVGKSSKSSYRPGVPVFTTMLKRAHLTENFFLISEHRQRYLETGPAKYYAWTVKNIEPIESEEVFCCTVPETGCFVLEDNILTSNCFLFPLSKGGWRVYRFSPGVAEAESWTQDGEGWTTCLFNKPPDLSSLCKTLGGIEDPDQNGYVFKSISQVREVAKILGQDIKLTDQFDGREILLKAHKDGRLVIQIKREKGDAPLDDWLEKKNKWVRIFDVKTAPEEELDQSVYDNLIRALKTPAKEGAGFVLHEGGEWVRQTDGRIKLTLQGMGNDKTACEETMGVAIAKTWKLVNLPFQPEYPGGRQWNLDAPQFRFKPAELGDDVPCHPHWDMIFGHVGADLTPAIRESAVAAMCNIKTGADYLRAWVACAFRDPFEPLPYLFLFGPENSGKSIFHEGLAALVTKGVVSADRALSSNNDFNGELAGAVICYVEEKDLSQSKHANARIKEYVTARMLPIRKMRTDAYSQPNTTHWIQCANRQTNCPVFPGDTRITVLYVDDLLPDQEIPKKEMMVHLENEAPHFMHTLLTMQLPPVKGRLRLPVITTANKIHSEEMSKDELERFIDEFCTQEIGAKLPFKDFYERFFTWVPAEEKHQWPRNMVQRRLPMGHLLVVGHTGLRYISNLKFKD